MNALSTADWTTITAGVGAIGVVNWYFFVAGHRSVAAAAELPDRQDITVTVRGGYDPATIRVKAGRPVRLRFDRQETSGCSEEVVFADFGLRTFLPAHQQTVIDVTPPHAGTYEFTCGMGMLRGRLIAE